MTALEFLNKKREEHYASGGLALGIDQIRPMLRNSVGVALF